MKKGKVAVIGLGQLGMALAECLSNFGAEVIGIDSNINVIEAAKDKVAYVVNMDSTDESALVAQSIQEVDTAVVTIGGNFENVVLTSVILQELGVKKVIARASNAHQHLILEKMGIHEILNPEANEGVLLAHRLINPSIKKFFPLPDDYEIVEIETPKRVVNMQLKDMGLRERYDLNLITIKNSLQTVDKKTGAARTEEHIVGVPKADSIVKATDQLVLMGKRHNVNRFIEVNS
ncbi:TrkA family potassium uptake protein [Persicobacter psychrovividus]|uniref:TrkA family potassium uptake protein n=1 Tax=Persicobacter psychrovividus TaxID=387638 RepID=A0ABM7VGE9_9BACT|nr:TrkA family potassium uptake protein [Persicobacter psychrovividus]